MILTTCNDGKHADEELLKYTSRKARKNNQILESTHFIELECGADIQPGVTSLGVEDLRGGGWG